MLRAAAGNSGGPSGPGPGLFAWGSNGNGMLGIGNTANRSSPVQVGALTTWRVVAAGYQHSLAVKVDGTLWSWGRNIYGGLGSGDVVSRSSPFQVGALTTWVSVSGGRYQSLGLKSDGTLWSWGQNNTGELGLGDAANRSSPTQVGSLTAWTSVSAGADFTLALKSDGTLWSWGLNSSGQLGVGDAANRSSPVQVGSLATWASLVRTGGYSASSFAIKSDGTLWSWGDNGHGQLGLGDGVTRSSPTQIGSLTTWRAVAIGYTHALALKSDGTLWAWGRNNYGKLGVGDAANRSSPTQVGALSTWTAIKGLGTKSSAAIRSDGTVWTWGYNTFGALGLGDAAHRSSPTQVGSLNTWTAIEKGGQRALALN